MSRTQKFLVLLSSFFIAFPSFFLAYAHFSSKLTDWQREQAIDFDAQTGATKFEAYINSMTVAGICFVFSAAIILLVIKYSKKNEQK